MTIQKKSILKASAMALMILLTILVIPIEAKTAENKFNGKESLEKVTLTIFDKDGKIKKIVKWLPKDEFKKIKEKTDEISRNPDKFEEKLMELENLLKEDGLVPESFSFKSMMNEIREEYGDLSWGDFKKKILREYPLFSPIVKRKFEMVEAKAGISDDDKLDKLKSANLQIGGSIFDFACLVMGGGLGYILPSWPFIVFGIVLPSPVLVGLLGGLTTRFPATMTTYNLLLSTWQMAINPIFFILGFGGIGISAGIACALFIGVAVLVVAL